MQIKTYLQGFYDNGILNSALKNSNITSDNSVSDVIDVMFYDPADTTEPVETIAAFLRINGEIDVVLPEILVGNDYYISLKHRNSIQVWSASAVTLSDDLFYNFTVANAAYSTVGSTYPMAEVESGVFAMYTGDVNQDGVIDSGDYSAVENDVIAIKFGYIPTDLAGIGAAESASYSLIENNIQLLILAIKP
jgi:hypothetical protein